MFTDYDLDDIVRRFPLPEGVTDDVVNREELAQALGKTVNMIDRYRKGGMPVEGEGGNGRSYEFQLSYCWAWFHAWKDDRKTRDRERQENLTRLQRSLLNDDDDHDEHYLSAEERRKNYEAEKLWMATAEARGQLGRVNEFRLAFEGLFAINRRFLMDFPDVVERRLGLSAEQVEVLIELCDGQCAAQRAYIENSNLANPVDKAASV